MSQKKQKKLTSKQQLFCEEYIKDYNGSRAAEAAGFSKKTAASQAYNMLQQEHIQEQISKCLNQQQKRTQTDADKIVEEYAKVAFANIKDYYDSTGKLIDIQKLGRIPAAAIKKIKETEYVSSQSGDRRVVREFELHSKLEALTKLGDHFRIFDKEKDPELTDINVNVTIKRNKKKKQ